MPNWYLQFDFSRLGCQRARVQPAATVPNEKQQETFREAPKLHSPKQQMNFSILQNTCDIWVLVPALHGAAAPLSTVEKGWSTGVSSQILSGGGLLYSCPHGHPPCPPWAHGGCPRGWPSCWPSLASSSQWTPSAWELSMEECGHAGVTHHVFAVKPGTVPGRSGCTVLSRFLQKKQWLVLALPEQGITRLVRRRYGGRYYNLGRLARVLFAAHSASPEVLLHSALVVRGCWEQPVFSFQCRLLINPID